jgi:hypothetical protein
MVAPSRIRVAFHLVRSIFEGALNLVGDLSL